MLNKIRSVMFGHAVGDALGVPVEFIDRRVLDQNPVTDMLGFGTHKVPAGSWSDDTSMSLCALKSLAQGFVDYNDIMKNFCRWYYDEQFTPTGVVFDIGNTCMIAIDNYFYRSYPAKQCGLSDEMSNGNGSLMRIHPFVLYEYYHGIENENNFVKMIENASALTHAHVCSVDGCVIYSYVLMELLDNPTKSSVYKGLNKAKNKIRSNKKYYGRLFDEDICKAARESIKSSGYVVDTLEAALWCLLTTDNYKDCVLKAVNLGSDTDTVAAIAGGLAGALYGMDSIPTNWLNKLKKKDYIEDICNVAYDKWRFNEEKDL